MLALVLACALPAAAAAAPPPSAPWPELLPPRPVSDATQPGPVPGCRRATLRCVDRLIARMRRLRDGLGCDHRAVFATTYMLLTRQVRDTMRRDPRFFRDRRWIVYEAQLFANYYFESVKRDRRGQPVPGAWAVAFRAAREGDANAGQDMLLGINAHVQRDMPFVVASVGLRTRDGRTRKPDHDAMNRVLAAAYEPIVSEIGRRYDSLITISNSSWSPVDDIAGLELVKSWREGVWRNAERLVAARTPEERQGVIDSIEANATSWAHLMADPTFPPGYRAQRDAFCERREGGAALPALGA